ncbi:MAG: MarR family transcriptional regulator [Gemmatimonadota bacterium]|nr:MarR family transcriptional regulator [Gemmatimonadota bacterium]
MSSSHGSARPGRARRRSTSSEAVANRLHSAAIHLLRRLRIEDEATGLGAPALSALSVIVFAGPITLGDLARAEQVRPPTITRLVTSLEADGLVTRRLDARDRRVQRVHATARGRQVLEAGRARRVASLARHIRELPARDRAILEKSADLLEAMLGNRHPGRP